MKVSDPRSRFDPSDIGRLAIAAHYVISRTAPSELGATKLNKILWYADLESHRQTGSSLSGARSYVRKPRGPVPFDIEEALRLLKREHRIREERVRVITHERREFFPLVEPDMSQFAPFEIAIIDNMIRAITPMTANEISDITHEDDLWDELANGDVMPVGVGAIITREPTEAELTWARSVSA